MEVIVWGTGRFASLGVLTYIQGELRQSFGCHPCHTDVKVQRVPDSSSVQATASTFSLILYVSCARTWSIVSFGQINANSIMLV
ncbi:hypothetical protein CGRA01v4_06214 [Colletotrichum graminicola]|nr:hypothetical protein CGRA01v4_06214 [Colletotrichum graminicola]